MAAEIRLITYAYEDGAWVIYSITGEGFCKSEVPLLVIEGPETTEMRMIITIAHHAIEMAFAIADRKAPQDLEP